MSGQTALQPGEEADDAEDDEADLLLAAVYKTPRREQMPDVAVLEDDDSADEAEAKRLLDAVFVDGDAAMDEETDSDAERHLAAIYCAPQDPEEDSEHEVEAETARLLATTYAADGDPAAHPDPEAEAASALAACSLPLDAAAAAEAEEAGLAREAAAGGGARVDAGDGVDSMDADEASDSEVEAHLAACQLESPDAAAASTPGTDSGGPPSPSCLPAADAGCLFGGGMAPSASEQPLWGALVEALLCCSELRAAPASARPIRGFARLSGPLVPLGASRAAEPVPSAALFQVRADALPQLRALAALAQGAPGSKLALEVKCARFTPQFPPSLAPWS